MLDSPDNQTYTANPGKEDHGGHCAQCPALASGNAWECCQRRQRPSGYLPVLPTSHPAALHDPQASDRRQAEERTLDPLPVGYHDLANARYTEEPWAMVDRDRANYLPDRPRKRPRTQEEAPFGEPGPPQMPHDAKCCVSTAPKTRRHHPAR